MTSSRPFWLLPTVPWTAVESAFAAAPGNELTSGKLNSPESSAALAANAFGFFIDKPQALPVSALFPPCSQTARRVDIERSLRFPWSGGRHPWLDAVLETESWLIGVESKRYEPFRSAKPPKFSQAYSRPVWGTRMQPFLQMRDDLVSGKQSFNHLDATQLVKHALGLRTQAVKLQKTPALVYIFLEPLAWPDGRPISPDLHRQHQAEVRRFADAVAGAEVQFSALTYDSMISSCRASANQALRAHADALKEFWRA